MRGFVTNIEKDALNNDFFRQVIFTSHHSQLVLMALKPGEEIGEEVHDALDQFFRIEKGKGKAVIEGQDFKIEDGSAIVIPAGTKHNVINDSATETLKLYTIYSPPNHRDKTVHKTKEGAETSEEHFDGQVSFEE